MTRNTLKCPHCGGLMAVTGVERKALSETAKQVTRWLKTPVTVLDLLYEIGFEGDMTRFEPLDRLVYRTAFRSKDAIAALGMGVAPERMSYIVRELPDWGHETALTRVFGVQGRWWVKRGQQPGFMEISDDLV